jgi:hypothetical protein
MPTNVQDFDDDSAYERYVLARLTPLVKKPPGGIEVGLGDDGSISANVQAVAATTATPAGAPGDQFKFRDIAPLVFGAAWKVLDLLVELRLEQLHVSKNAQGRYSIEMKVGEADNGTVSAPAPFDNPQGTLCTLWEQVLKCYAVTKELRHSLVHRQLKVDPSTGAISGTPGPTGVSPRPLTPPLTPAELDAFCRVSEGVAEAVISGALSRRRADQLKWLLDQLGSHHQQPPFGIPSTDGLIPVFVVERTPVVKYELTLDFAAIRQRARTLYPSASYYDLQIRIPDGRILVAGLEDTPDDEVISLDALPDWLTWK